MLGTIRRINKLTKHYKYIHLSANIAWVLACHDFPTRNPKSSVTPAEKAIH